MCLSVPAKIIEIQGEAAKVSIGGSIVDIGIQLIDNVQIGDYVLVHTGFALEKISEEEALKTIEMIKQLSIEDEPEQV